jgi:hypothetical protein
VGEIQAMFLQKKTVRLVEDIVIPPVTVQFITGG